MLAELVHHIGEAGTAGLLGRLHINVLVDDPDAFGQRVVPQGDKGLGG
jgi:hypothetical protein